jgi:diguanylate cyclase (GGDEF)-like protein
LDAALSSKKARLKQFRAVRIWLCWLALAGGAQAQQYVFRVFRQPEGLKNIAVEALARDRAGFLWAGTENGLFRLTGSTFERFGMEQGLENSDISDILPDQNGTIWVSTREELYRWNGQRFQRAGSRAIPTTGPNRVAIEDGEDLLVANEGRLYRLKHSASGEMISYTPVFPEAMLTLRPELGRVDRVMVTVGKDGNRTVWMGCGNKLISFSENPAGADGTPETVTEWGKEQGLAEDTWESVLLDHSGTLWATGRRHIAVLASGSARFEDRSSKDSTSVLPFRQGSLIEDPQGRVLVTDGDGISRWEGGRWKHIGRDNGLVRNSSITGMAFDASGDLWLGSLGSGLYLWTGYANWEGWDDGQGLPSASIWAISASVPERINVGTVDGPGWIDPETGAAGKGFSGDKWEYGSVGGLNTASDGSLWAGTFSGNILHIDTKSGRVIKSFSVPGSIMNSVQLPNGAILYSATHGIWEIEKGSAPTQVAGAKQLVGDARVYGGCVAPDGGAWFLTNNRLLHLSAENWTEPKIDGLPSLQASLIALRCAADGAIWVTGPQAGIWRLTPEAEHLRAWPLKTPEEFKSLIPVSIFLDKRGWLWLGTDQGLLVWNGREWRHLTQESGLVWNDVNQASMVEAADGSLWIGTSGGVAHLLHPERVFDPIQLSASLTELRHGAENYLGRQSITIPWGGAALLFQISSPVMRNRSELLLKFRMLGRQADWIPTEDGIVAFTRLDPGSYTFQAMACNPGINVCSNQVSVAVTVLPPWWQTNWFRGLCAFAFLLLLAAADRLRARHLSQRSKQLETLVRIRTAELEASREQLRIQASHDTLTGMLNHGAVLRSLDAEIQRSRREGGLLVVAMADLDYFKRINDTHGHLAGDEALRQFSTAARGSMRLYDHVGRYGGEEFLFLLAEIPAGAIEQRLATLHLAISNLTIRTPLTEFGMTCSIGATVFDPFGTPSGADSLLAIADMALYDAKRSGRNRVILRKTDERLDETKNPIVQSLQGR